MEKEKIFRCGNGEKCTQSEMIQLISKIVAWVHSAGFDCAIKPDSYTASGIANKFSK